MSFVFGANSASTGYNLTRSLRFRASATAYLSRTPASASNRKTFTLSTWVKRGALGARQSIFDAYAASAGNSLEFQTSDILEFYAWGGASVFDLATTQVFRDPSAWYHIVVAVDTTQATAANRIKLYINGTQVTAFGTATYPSLNADLYINNNIVHNIGRRGDAQFYFDGYLAEDNFVDGQALTPSSFGSTNALTGVWQPARYTGTYGTNGFYLPFTDNSALTTSSNVGLGKDFSGNANYWVTNNISITAGVTYDSMTDVPTLTSATASNFAVLNPVALGIDATLTNGNLNIAYGSAATRTGTAATIGMTSGKYYWEVTVTASSASPCNAEIGISNTTENSSVSSGIGYYPGYTANGWGYYGADGAKYNGAVGVAYGATFTTNDVIGVAFDATAGSLTFYKNNTSQGVAYSSLAAGTYYPAVGDGGGAATITMVANFGQRPFTYTPPTGFVALNTYNLPTSTIVKGNTVMDATLWAGNSSTQSIVNAAAFKTDFVWIKNRTGGNNHALFDSVRGATLRLYSDSTIAEQTEATTLTAFNSNGFSVSTSGAVNASANNYVGWQWQAGQGTTSSNTNGTITSTVSVNASAGFSVVTYTGTLITTPSPPPTVGHGLGVAPSLVISKSRSVAGVDSGAWFVWTSAQATDNYLRLNTTAASASISGGGGGTMVAPTSSVFSTPYISGSNVLANNYVAYCWTPIAGFSAFGSYTGNSSTDGTFVYTGFRPKFVMIKEITTGGTNWNILDTSRDPYNVEQNYLAANSAGAEGVLGLIDGLSNGFKLRNAALAVNLTGSTYIYMAFAENPFKNALAR